MLNALGLLLGSSGLGILINGTRAVFRTGLSFQRCLNFRTVCGGCHFFFSFCRCSSARTVQPVNFESLHQAERECATGARRAVRSRVAHSFSAVQAIGFGPGGNGAANRTHGLRSVKRRLHRQIQPGPSYPVEAKDGYQRDHSHKNGQTNVVCAHKKKPSWAGFLPEAASGLSGEASRREMQLNSRPDFHRLRRRPS